MRLERGRGGEPRARPRPLVGMCTLTHACTLPPHQTSWTLVHLTVTSLVLDLSTAFARPPLPPGQHCSSLDGCSGLVLGALRPILLGAGGAALLNGYLTSHFPNQDLPQF